MKITVHALEKLVQDQQKIAMLTCYDASFSTVMDQAGVEVLLVGDSLGMVIQGHHSTLPVTMEQMLYHTQIVARAAARALVLADLPFASYQGSPQQAFDNAAKLMAVGAQMVKLEGGVEMAETVRFLVKRGIPVCGHIGFTPQAVNVLGVRVQGRSDADAEQVLADARALQDAGAAVVVLEMVPADLARRITAELHIPTIGIGAGVDCSGQVLVVYDLLGLYSGKVPRFVKNFMHEAASISGAVEAYVKAVKAGTFPTAEHCY